MRKASIHILFVLIPCATARELFQTAGPIIVAYVRLGVVMVFIVTVLWGFLSEMAMYPCSVCLGFTGSDNSSMHMCIAK